jgi:hypothetical protein
MNPHMVLWGFAACLVVAGFGGCVFFAVLIELVNGALK